MGFRAVPVLLLVLPVIASAHHSTLEFDQSQSIEFEGEVVRALWGNPHVQLTIRTHSADGDEELWGMEAGPLYGLLNAGLPRNPVSVGDQIRVSGYPSTRRDLYMQVRNILLSSGRELVLLGSEPYWSTGDVAGGRDIVIPAEVVAASKERANGIFRVWTFIPRRGQVEWSDELPLTEHAVAASATFNPEVDDATRRCVAPGMPRAMTQNPHPIEFVDDGEVILLRMQEFDVVRTIHMDESRPPEDTAHMFLGYSIGRWEEQALVVETTHISYPLFNRTGVPQSERVEIVERFILSDGDEPELSYEIELSDPITFTEPIVGTKKWRWEPGLEIRAYDCEYY